MKIGQIKVGYHIAPKNAHMRITFKRKSFLKKYSADHDQLASDEASCSGSALFFIHILCSVSIYNIEMTRYSVNNP